MSEIFALLPTLKASIHQIPVVLQLLSFTHVALCSGSAGMDYSLYLNQFPTPAPLWSSLISLRTFLSSPKDQGWQRLISLLTSPSVSSGGYGFHPPCPTLPLDALFSWITLSDSHTLAQQLSPGILSTTQPKTYHR